MYTVRRSGELGPAERDNVRAAVLYLCERYGTMAAQVATLGMSRDSITKVRSRTRGRPTESRAWSVRLTTS
jgi:hypothetical protein